METASKREILFIFQKELNQLEKHFNTGGRIIWLTGREGIGKTTLVKYFAEKVGDYEYIDLKTETVGDDFHEKLKELIQVKRLVILDNYDYRFEQNGHSFLEVSKLQKKLGETGSTVIVVSRERLFMYPMFVYMASLSSEQNCRIDLTDLNYKKIWCTFKKSYSDRDRILLSSCLDGSMNKLAIGLSSGKSVREVIIDLLGYRDLWMKKIKRDHEAKSLSPDNICKVYRCVANGIILENSLNDGCFPYLSSIRYFDFEQGRVRNSFSRFDITDQSMKFFFRFVYDFDTETDAGKYYDEVIAPNLESFAVDYWHLANFRHSEDLHPMKGRLVTESGMEIVYIAHEGFDRLARQITICDYNLSETPYGMDRLTKTLFAVEKTKTLSHCGRVSVHVFSVSGFTADVEKKAQELGVVLYNDMWYREKHVSNGGGIR